MTETELREDHRRVQREIETAVYVGKLEDNQASLLRSIRRYRKAYETEREMHEQTAILREELQAKYDALRAERDALQAWKDAVPVQEIDIVASDGIVMREWPHRCAAINEWCEAVRCKHNYLSDAERMEAMRRMSDGTQ